MKRAIALLPLILLLSCEQDEDQRGAVFPSETVAWVQIYGAGVTWHRFGLDDSLRFVSPAALVYGELECEVGAGAYVVQEDSLILNPGLDSEKSYVYALQEDDQIFSLQRESGGTREYWEFQRGATLDCDAYGALEGLDAHFSGQLRLFQDGSPLDTLDLVVWAENGFVWLQGAQNRVLMGARALPGAGSAELRAGSGVYRTAEWAPFFLRSGTLTLSEFSVAGIRGSLEAWCYDPSSAPSGNFDPDLALRLDFEAQASIASAPAQPWTAGAPAPAWPSR